MGLPPLVGPAIGFWILSSSAEVATMKGTEFVGEGGKSAETVEKERKQRHMDRWMSFVCDQ